MNRVVSTTKSLTVMEPILAEYPLVKPENFFYEVKWDGVRLLAIVESDHVRIINRHGRDKTRQFPELQHLRKAIKTETAIIDGEGVVIKNGAPDFPAVIKRNNRQSSPDQLLMNELPLTFMMFDLLEINGQSWCNRTYEERKGGLMDIVDSTKHLQIVEQFSHEVNLWSAIRELNLEGMVAKRKGSFYQGGKKHNNWFKIKNRRQQWFVIGGYRVKDQQLNNLMLGTFIENQLIYCGRVGVTGSLKHHPVIWPVIMQYQVSQPILMKLPDIKDEYYYVKPTLGALIEFAEWTPELNLRQPVLKAVKPWDQVIAGGLT